MTTTATQQTSEQDLNQLNTTLKQQPWYQQFFKERGLDMNRVHLNNQQKDALTNLAGQNGFALGDRMKFDEAGNMNQKGGFAGMPTWAKIALSAAPVAGSMLIPGVREATLGHLGSVFGAGEAPGSMPEVTGSLAHAALPAAVNTGITGAAAPSLMSQIAAHGKDILGVGGRMLGQVGQAAATNRGTMIDAQMSHDALQLQADRMKQDAETDAMRKSLFGQLAAGYTPAARPTGVPTGTPGGYTTQQAHDIGQGITDTAVNRMKTQDYPGITPFSQLPVKPGLMEQIANYGAPALSLFDPRLFGKR